MNDVYIKKLFLYLGLLAMIGCATTQGEQATREYTLNPISTRTVRAPSPSTCPSSDRSWRRERLSQLVNHANNCSQLGRWDRVEALGDHMAVLDPGAPWGAYYLSLAAQGRGELPRALWMSDLALKKSPRTALLHYQKGRIHWDLEEYDQAIEGFQSAVRLDPNMADAHLFLAQVFYRDQDYGRAATHFNETLRLEPSNALAVAGLAECRLQRKDYKKAIEYYLSAINLQPRNVDYRFRLAYIYESFENNLEAALQTYRRILTIVRDNRIPASTLPINLEEKIKFLEASVAQQNNQKLTENETVRQARRKAEGAIQ
jgi:tetratricopeptide (TPR) repeat protein